MKLTVVLPMTAMNRIGMTVTSCVVNAQGLELQVSMNGGGDRPLVDLHPQVCKQLGEKASQAILEQTSARIAYELLKP